MEGGAFGLILFTERTTAQIWILGFAAWRALEVYCPYSFLRIAITPDAIAHDPGLVGAEQALGDALSKARELKDIENLEAFTWPDIPVPGVAPPLAATDRAVVDLIKIAAAFCFLHEVQHEIFKTSSDRPETAPEEEYECDKFASDFLLERVSEYSADTQQDRQGVLDKRLMGIMLGAFVILEVTPEVRRGGTHEHPPLANRLRQLILKPNHYASEHVWIYACSLLLGKLREEAELPRFHR
jgi:Peptidase U49